MSNRRKARKGLPDTAHLQLDLVVVDHAGKRVLEKSWPVDIPEALMSGEYNVSVLLNPRSEAAAAVANHRPEMT